MKYNIGVDIGGTFTDCVVVDEAGELTIGKALSTPDNFADGVFNAVRNAAQNLGMDGEETLLRSTNLFLPRRRHLTFTHFESRSLRSRGR
jgi:N-methylhydantoinase A